MYEKNGNFIKRVVETDNQNATSPKWSPYRHLCLKLDDGTILNDGSDTETVSVEVVDGLNVAKGTDPANATSLNHNGDVTLSVDGSTTTKTLTNGSVEFDLTTDKSAGSEIEIVAESLADHPAERGSATIEVVSQ
jgi:hypothetical protein